MAADLAGTPATGLRVQACGDAHLCNFGAFATPERRVIFDINDLDETLPAPWEWDVKRLAASIVVASRSNGFSRRDARDATLACVRSYREHMAELSQMRVLDVWYASIEIEKLLATVKDKAARQRQRKRLASRPGAQRGGARLPEARRPLGPGAQDQGQPAAHLPPAGGGRGRHAHAGPGVVRRSTGKRCRRTDGCCSTGSSSRTSRSRWWGSAASAPTAPSCC